MKIYIPGGQLCLFTANVHILKSELSRLFMKGQTQVFLSTHEDCTLGQCDSLSTYFSESGYPASSALSQIYSTFIDKPLCRAPTCKRRENRVGIHHERFGKRAWDLKLWITERRPCIKNFIVLQNISWFSFTVETDILEAADKPLL